MTTLSPGTKVLELLEAHPFIEGFLISLSPKFRALKNPIMRATVAKFATLNDAAGMADLPVPELIKRIQGKISDHDPKKEPKKEEEEKLRRKSLLKGILTDLHRGDANPEKVEEAKARFAELVKSVDATEIAELEQSLIADGVSESEITRLCDVHVKVMEGGLDPASKPDAPPGHPVNTFMRENRAAEDICSKIELEIGKGSSGEGGKSTLHGLLVSLMEIDKHYLRKENQLFPMLEKHGITGPSRVMWELDDQIRRQIKEAAHAMESAERPMHEPLVRAAVQAVKDMIFKEENILFPMALSTLSDGDWEKVRHGEEELGYAWLEGVPEWGSKTPAAVTSTSAGFASPVDMDGLRVDTGFLSLEQIRLIFTHMPVDLSFVNENDEVLFYSGQKERIFPRSPGVIGRKVQNCHPGKSVHIVNEILAEFKRGNRSSSEFWIQFQGRFIHIRYFAVRDEAGAYRGCLEVSQDVTDIRKLEGERRILEWR